MMQSDYNSYRGRTPGSVFRRGAENGLWFGAYLSAIVVCAALSRSAEVLSLVALGLMIGVPVVIYWALRRDYRATGCKASFSEVWMHGICIFVFGSLIMALVIYLGLRFAAPGFIADQLRAAIEVYREIGSAEADSMADAMQLLIDSHELPTPINMAFSMIWATVFTGSVLSLIEAAIVRATTRPTPPQPPMYNAE